jgi:phosphonoacetate hydrolase
MYSPDLSLFVLDAGISLLQQKMVDLLYLSLSDLVQHAHAPGEPEADAFHAAVDQRIGKILSHGAVLGVTADHGMNDKALPNGAPNVVFLEDELNKRFGSGAVRVICPITDPFTKHHGSMGSFVRVYNLNGKDTSDMMKASETLPGIELVLSGKEAAARFELPLDREGDFVVISERNKVIGARQKDHDFAGLAGHRLRSHGGVSEQKVPFLLSHPLNPEYQKIASARRLRNFDIFEFALNSV